MKLLRNIVIMLATLIAGSVTYAQSNLVLFISQPGDYVGQGQTYMTTDSNSFSISNGPALIAVTAFGFNFYFAGPDNSPLNVASYPDSVRYPFNASLPGIDISGHFRGCGNECGAFHIFELHTNLNGQVDHLWVTYSNTCECGSASMTGEIRYNSQLAPPAEGSLQAGLNSGQLVLSWTGPGTLQWAPTPSGPYSDTLIQGQSYTNQDMSAGAKFFRLKQ